MKILDDIVPVKTQNIIKNMCLNTNFPWYYWEKTEEHNPFNLENIYQTGGFFHSFYGGSSARSPLGKYVLPVLNYYLQSQNQTLKSLLRCKANFLTPVKYTDGKHNIPHTDDTEPHLVLLYYVIDSDGDTVFFNDKFDILNRVTPKQGRIVAFNGSVLHAASNPVEFDTRIVINYNYTI